MKYEGVNTKYKRTLTDDIYKSVIAFANTSGGTIYVGADDDGMALVFRLAKSRKTSGTDLSR